jgi:hypothetical protein
MSRSLRRRILYAVLGLLGVNAVFGLIVVLGGSPSGTGGKVVASSFLVAGGCLLALAGSAVSERVQPLAVTTIFANGLACVLLMLLLWDSSSGDSLARVTFAVTSVSIYGSLASLLISRNRPDDTPEIRWAQALALAGFGALAFLGLLGAAGAVDGSSDAWKLAGASAILGILGVLATPIMRAAKRNEDDTPAREPARADLAPATLDDLIGLRVVAINGASRDVLVFENGTRVRSH